MKGLQQSVKIVMIKLSSNHKHSSNSEFETVWVRLIFWPLKTPCHESEWPFVSRLFLQINKSLWVLCGSMNFHPDKQLFQVAGVRTTDPWITRSVLSPYTMGGLNEFWILCISLIFDPSGPLVMSQSGHSSQGSFCKLTRTSERLSGITLQINVYAKIWTLTVSLPTTQGGEWFN